MPFKDKKDRIAYQKRWREENRAKVNAYGQYNQAARRKRNRDLVDQAKNRPCIDCGNEYPPCVMDFDHVSGKKLYNVAKMVSLCYSPEIIQAEIDKCEVVCANCHRLRTHLRNREGQQ